MKQNVPISHAGAIPIAERPVLGRIARAVACGASVFALSVPLAGPVAAAEGWQTTWEYFPGGAIRTTRKLVAEGGGAINELNRPAPGNNCPVPAFEVLNPRPGELRCVGYVVPYWLP